MKIEMQNKKLKPSLVYAALTLFVFLSTFLSTHHNHAFGEAREDCPAYILNITFHSANQTSFSTPGIVQFYNPTYISIIDEFCSYNVFYVSIAGRSPPSIYTV